MPEKKYFIWYTKTLIIKWSLPKLNCKIIISYNNSYNKELLLERLKKLSTILKIWKSRSLSLKGKITILKTLAIPQIQFLFNMIYIPENIIKKIDNLIYNFLWNSKLPKIKKSTIIAPIPDGGLSMVDTHSIHQSAKISWIKRLFDLTN